MTVQTLTLTAIQVLPLFLLPEILLPLARPQRLVRRRLARPRRRRALPRGELRPRARVLAGLRPHPRLAAHRLQLVHRRSRCGAGSSSASLQTFVLIPALIYFWGKGAYCGWICSCGALAETLGDPHRHKMPHGPGWNRLNMLGQVILLLVVAPAGPARRGLDLAELGWPPASSRSASTATPGSSTSSSPGSSATASTSGSPAGCGAASPVPLAALMHVYARFSRFRILAEKKKCISCNVCTTVCHQGIDVMNFANKGLPMEDPECVRCSACVQSCPTGVLSFGQVDRKTGRVLGTDPAWLQASPVQRVELKVRRA